ncbi:MAG: hypothetical protein Q4F52_11580 [Bacteroidaceae bacterium]|nr:hypothetical protein [Bacteroidaceae bacterium]
MSLTQVALDQESLAMLDATAVASTFSREEALKEAISQYCEYDRWFRAKVEEGRKAIKEGRFITNDEAKLRAAARRERILASMGQPE